MHRFTSFFNKKIKEHVDELGYQFDDAKDMRLLEDMYTQDEVCDILDGLSDVLKSNAKTELDEFIETSGLFLKEILLQAEAQGANVEIDTATLDEQALLAGIDKLIPQRKSQNLQMKMKPLTPASLPSLSSKAPSRLASLTSSAISAQKLKSLETREKDSQQRIKDLEKQLSVSRNESTSLAKQLRDNIIPAPSETPAPRKEDPGRRESLAATQLRSTHAELEKLRMELDKRVADTKQFASLRAMLQQKNKQLHEARATIEQLRRVRGNNGRRPNGTRNARPTPNMAQSLAAAARESESSSSSGSD